jgi:hypothetical protein
MMRVVLGGIVRRGLCAGVVAVAGFACQPRTATKAPSPKVGLRVTSGALARQHSRITHHIDLPFQLVQRGVSGTGIVLGFLQRLQTWGAVYASDVTYSLQMIYNGLAIECVSKITVDDGSPASAPDEATVEALDEGDADYTTTVKPWRPRTTSAWVIDRELVCEKHAQQVAVSTPRYANNYNAEIKRFMPPQAIPNDTTQIVYYDECTYRPSRRYVHRYEHFVVARFSPPDVEVIGRRYADVPLIHEQPLCHEIQLAPGQQLRQHVEADVHFPSEIVRDREYVPELVRPVESQGGEG